VSIYPESKDPLDPGIDLCIYQLGRDGAIGAVGPWIPPHCHPHHWSGRTWWPMKVRRRSVPINPSQNKLRTISCMGCSLRVSFLATMYPQLGWMTGCLPVTAGSGAPTSFLWKKHSFCHPTSGLETERPVWVNSRLGVDIDVCAVPHRRFRIRVRP
jgi:hypothetical protein